MLNYIIGTLEGKFLDKIIVETNCIGYEILTSLNTIQTINLGDQVKIYTKLLVREDDIQIVGFITKDELQIFNLLKSVSKVGPKLALSSLSLFKPGQIKQMIVESDINSLIKIPGMGKKTAERVLLELKDKIEIDYYNTSDFISKERNTISIETIDALVSLGFSKRQSEEVINTITAKSDFDINNQHVETLLKMALIELK